MAQIMGEGERVLALESREGTRYHAVKDGPPLVMTGASHGFSRAAAPVWHIHRVSDAIQPSHPLSSPSPPAPNPSQHQGLFQ